jgi:hypothetical protein
VHLEPGQTCIMLVSFAPGAATGFATVVGLFTDAGGPPGNVQQRGTLALSGAGVEPSMLISPPALAFGDVEVGTISNPLVATIHNTGVGPLTIAVLGSSGFATAGCAFMILQPGGACVFTVLFMPDQASSFAGQITVLSDSWPPGALVSRGTMTVTGAGIIGGR